MASLGLGFKRFTADSVSDRSQRECDMMIWSNQTQPRLFSMVILRGRRVVSVGACCVVPRTNISPAILYFSVVYATLVTLDGSQDGTEQHQLVTVPSDLTGQQIDLSAFANLAGQAGITVSDLQVCILSGFSPQLLRVWLFSLKLKSAT